MLFLKTASLGLAIVLTTTTLADDHFREFPDAEVVTPMELFRALAQMQDLPPELINEARRLAEQNGIQLNRDPNGAAKIPRGQNDPNGQTQPNDPSDPNARTRQGNNPNDPNGANPNGVNPNGANPNGANPNGANPRGSSPDGSNPDRSNPDRSNPRGQVNPPGNGLPDAGDGGNSGRFTGNPRNNNLGNRGSSRPPTLPGRNPDRTPGNRGSGNGNFNGGGNNSTPTNPGNGAGSSGSSNNRQNSPDPTPTTPPRSSPRQAPPPSRRPRGKSDENFRQRMNRILMDAARDAAKTSPDEQEQRSGLEKLLAMAQDRVEKSLEKNGPAMRRRMRSRWNDLRNNVRKPNPSTQWLSDSPSAPTLPRGAGRAWLWLVAVLVIGVAAFMLLRRRWPHTDRRSALQRARHAKQVQWMIRGIKTRKDFVAAFDEFVIWSGGSQSRSWNSQTVQASLVHAHPEYSKQIGQLVDEYNFARYAPDALQAGEADRLVQSASTLQHLATAGASDPASIDTSFSSEGV